MVGLPGAGMSDDEGAPDKGVDPPLVAQNPLALQMQVSAQKTDEERRHTAMGMM